MKVNMWKRGVVASLISGMLLMGVGIPTQAQENEDKKEKKQQKKAERKQGEQQQAAPAAAPAQQPKQRAPAQQPQTNNPQPQQPNQAAQQQLNRQRKQEAAAARQQQEQQRQSQSAQQQQQANQQQSQAARQQQRRSQQVQQQVAEQQQQRINQYREAQQQQQIRSRQRTDLLQQQKRLAQYRYEQQYWTRMRQINLQNTRNYNTNRNAYFYAAPNYRYSRDGRNYETNQYGANMLRQAVNYGYEQGFRAGQADRQDRWKSSYQDSYGYQDANYGYSGYYVDQTDYNYYFREGFRRGYEDGYGSRNQYGRNSGGKFSILGAVLSGILNLESIR